MASTSVNNWIARQKALSAALTVQRLQQLATMLGVSPRSLKQLGLGWSTKDHAWTFPERDHGRQVIGLLRRYPGGEKKVFSGSQRGLYFPKNWREIPGPVLVPEGASDVAALLSRGLCAVGRPSCRGGVEELAKLFAATTKLIVVLGENDQKPDGAWPGRDGAKEVAAKLAGLLGREVRWTLPPSEFKDVREMVVKGNYGGE